LKGTLTNNRTRWHGNVLLNPKECFEYVNKRKIPKRVMKIMIWEQQARKDVTHRDGRP
jgi:hypothetical protein